MSSRFDLPAVDRFVVGTIGMPGDRTFYFQSVVGRDVLSFKCEKAQVAALVNALGQLISELPPPDPEAPPFVALDLQSDTVADYNWITPNQFNDMHTTLSSNYGVCTGDAARIV